MTTGGAPAPVAAVDVVIVAGGRATRMGALAAQVPKCLLPVGDATVLDHQLRACAALAPRRVIVAAGHLGEAIARHLRHTTVEVVIEQRPMGSGGAVRAALGGRAPRPVVVLFGDVMTNADLPALVRHHAATGAAATVLLHPNDHMFDSDLVEVADGNGNEWIVELHKKPHPPGTDRANLVVAGAYVLSPDAVATIAVDRPTDLTHDVIGGLLATGRAVAAHRSPAYAKDMGTPERYAHVLDDWEAGHIAARAPGRRRPGVIFDRDGTLIRPAGLVTHPDQVDLPVDVGEAVAALNRAGVLVAVATNQSVLARGLVDEAGLRRIHNRLETLLGRHGAWIDAFFVCPHHPDAGYPEEVPALKVPCECRKPAPGLVERAIAHLHLDRDRTVVIGDQPTDVEAARRAGLPGILVRPLPGPAADRPIRAMHGDHAGLPSVTEAVQGWLARHTLAPAER